MIAAVIVTSVAAYLFIAGICGTTFYAARKSRCADCRDHRGCYNDHGVAAMFVGAGWPFAIPVIIGALTAHRMQDSERESRAASKHSRRMAKVEAENERRRLDIEKTRLNIEFLKQNGISADVPGLFERNAS